MLPSIAQILIILVLSRYIVASAGLPNFCIAYDDAFPETAGYQEVVGDMIALRCTPPAYPFVVQEIQVNITEGGDDVDVFLMTGDAAGPSTPVSATNTVRMPSKGTWVTISFTNSPIQIATGDIFIVCKWRFSSTPKIGIDRSPPSELRTWLYEGNQWARLDQKYPQFSSDQAMCRVLGACVVPKAHTNALFSLVRHDDSSAERSGYQDIVGDMIALRCTPPFYPFRLDEIWVDVVNFGGNPQDLLDVYIYGGDTNGPGQMLGACTNVQSSTIAANGNAWIPISAKSQTIEISSNDFFISCRWKMPASPQLGVDTGRPSELRTWVYEGGALVSALQEISGFLERQFDGPSVWHVKQRLLHLLKIRRWLSRSQRLSRHHRGQDCFGIDASRISLFSSGGVR